MYNPKRWFQRLPWRSLLKISLATHLIIFGVETFLYLGYNHVFVIHNTLAILFSGPLALLMPIILGIGVGALAVYLLERFQPQVYINTSILWGLLLYLLLGLIIKELFKLPSTLIDLSRYTLVGMALGIFWKGRPYWRY